MLFLYESICPRGGMQKNPQRQIIKKVGQCDFLASNTDADDPRTAHEALAIAIVDRDGDRHIRTEGGQDGLVMGPVSAEVHGGDIAVGGGASRWVDDRRVN